MSRITPPSSSSPGSGGGEGGPVAASGVSASNSGHEILVGTTVQAQLNQADDAISEKVSGDGILTIVKVTQAEYDELSPPDATTFYVIV